jgi:hypothetical protein
MASPYDKFSALLAAARLIAKRLLTPRSLWRCTVILATADTVTSTVTTTMRVVGSVHYNSTDSWAHALLAAAASLAELDVLVLFVADYTDTGSTINVNQTNFAARQLYLGVFTFFGHQLGTVASGTNQLGAFANLKLDRMDN